jgi:hypothetical protein
MIAAAQFSQLRHEDAGQSAILIERVIVRSLFVALLEVLEKLEMNEDVCGGVTT